MTVWDVGGQTKIRALWRHYYNNTDGIIWIVDSCDKERFKESCEEFQNVLSDPGMTNGVPILVFANKEKLKKVFLNNSKFGSKNKFMIQIIENFAKIKISTKSKNFREKLSKTELLAKLFNNIM